MEHSNLLAGILNSFVTFLGIELALEKVTSTFSKGLRRIFDPRLVSFLGTRWSKTWEFILGYLSYMSVLQKAL